jgi:hypothetical protein
MSFAQRRSDGRPVTRPSFIKGEAMDFKLKRGIAALVPMLGIAVVGAVGAQTLIAPETGVDPALVMEPEGSEPATVEANALSPNEVELVELSMPAEPVAAPEPIVVAERSVSANPVRVDREIVRAALPPTVSPRSGEGSGEEIATRTSPIDERESLVPDYQVDHSPGLERMRD